MTNYTPRVLQVGDKEAQLVFKTTREQLSAIDELAKTQPGIYYRSQAIRHLIDLGLQRAAELKSN